MFFQFFINNIKFSQSYTIDHSHFFANNNINCASIIHAFCLRVKWHYSFLMSQLNHATVHNSTPRKLRLKHTQSLSPTCGSTRIITLDLSLTRPSPKIICIKNLTKVFFLVFSLISTVTKLQHFLEILRIVSQFLYILLSYIVNLLPPTPFRFKSFCTTSHPW